MDMSFMPNAESTPASADTAEVARQDIMDLLSGFSLEVTSAEAQTVADFTSLIPAGTHVYLPFLPNSVFSDCVGAAKSLARTGMIPVPHIAARRLKGQGEFEDVLGQLRDTASVSTALVIAGDADAPAGPYRSAMELLETGLLEKYGISKIGITGYPEGHPAIAEDVIWASLARKCGYAKSSSADFQIVSQFTFSHQSVLGWEEKLKQAGVTLPVLLSVPGPAKLTTLLGYARMCGVSASLRQLTRNRKALMGLASISTPDRLLTGIAHHHAQQRDSLIKGIHFNTFGGFEETARWVKAILEGRLAMNHDNSGFKLARN
jgi:methylenetetrahydrofolate reductase (NADH)